MALTQLYTAIPNDVITAARWNNEFGNIYNNPGVYVNSASIIATGSSSSRSLSDRFGDILNVKDFGAVGNGVVDDTAAIAAVISVNDGRDIYWPDGTYLTTSSVANFHSRKHVGPGVLKRGSTLFYVDPRLTSGITNNLYVATTGNDTNDGISSSAPMLTPLAAGNIIYNYPYSDAIWAVNIAAGTYTVDACNFSRAFPSSQRVQFLGASVSTGTQPTTIFQASGNGISGLYFQNYIRAQVSCINFKNYKEGASPDANEIKAGLIADTFCELYTLNVWTDNCDQGIYITNGSEARIEGGRHGYNAINGCGVQFIRHAKGTVGYGGSAAVANGTTGVAFIGGTYGILGYEWSMVHADFCYFDTQTNAGVLLSISRVHSVSSIYLSCAVGIDARLNSNVGNTAGTFTTCTDDIRLLSGSVMAHGTYSEALSQGPPLTEHDVIQNSTSSLTPVSAYSRAYVANELKVRGAGFRLRIAWEASGGANTKTVTVKLGATTLLTATMAAATTDALIEVDLRCAIAASAQELVTSIFGNGVSPVIACSGQTMDLTGALTLTVEHSVTNGADISRVRTVELNTTH